MNFWDNPVNNQSKRSSPVIEDEWEYVDEETSQAEDNSPVGEAIKRIEQAKLYESLLKHDFFAPGSARAEIQNKVTAEIRDFLLERLTVLVGLTAPKQSLPSQVSISLPWNETQISALTHVADRLIEKHSTSVPTQAQPVVQPFAGQIKNPIVNVAKAQLPEPMIQQEPQKKMVRRRKEGSGLAPGVIPALPPGTKIDPLTGHPISDNGATLYPAPKISKTSKMKPMPKQSQIDSINATIAAKNSGGAAIGGMGNSMLMQAISHAQYNNRQYSEE